MLSERGMGHKLEAGVCCAATYQLTPTLRHTKIFIILFIDFSTFQYKQIFTFCRTACLLSLMLCDITGRMLLMVYWH